MQPSATASHNYSKQKLMLVQRKLQQMQKPRRMLPMLKPPKLPSMLLLQKPPKLQPISLPLLPLPNLRLKQQLRLLRMLLLKL